MIGNDHARPAADATRRRYPRLDIALPGRWAAAAHQDFPGELQGLSLGGCFVRTSTAEVADGAVVLVRLLLTGGWLLLRGEVVYASPGRGFAVRFFELAGPRRALLAHHLVHCGLRDPEGAGLPLELTSGDATAVEPLPD